MRLTACRYCGSTDLALVLDLGSQPLSNAFLREADIATEQRFPLDVWRCRRCTLVQLGYTVPPERVFGDYFYLTSSSAALVRHYRELASELTDQLALRDGDLVVDIGCNDGTLLLGFDAGLRRIGIEPSSVAAIAEGTGLRVRRAFFDAEVGAALAAAEGPARLVTATNVFAHVERIGSFVDGLVPLLGESGIFVAEVSYLPDLIDQTLFDTIYHEHLLYLSVTSMVPFLLAHGLDVIDVRREAVGASGPAFRIHIAVAGGSHRRSERVDAFLEEEDRWGVGSAGPYDRFAERARRVRERILDMLAGLRRGGARVGAYGAPAKGNTLLNFLGLDSSTIEMVAERNPLKQGLLTPGTHIQVVSEERFLEFMPSHALLLTWNYLDYFLRESEYIRRGGRFLVPLPEPRITP